MADQPHLTMRQRTALSVPPLLLRLVLAITFIWAGYTKIFGTMEVTEDNRAGLIAAGVLPGSQPEGPVPPPDPEPTPEPEIEPEIEPVPQPDDDTVIEPAPQTTPPTSPVEPAPSDPGPAQDPADDPSDDPSGDPGDQLADHTGQHQVLLVAQAAEPAQPERIRKYNQLATVVYNAGNPEPEDGQGGASTPMSLVPDPLGTPPWPGRLALAAAITELVAGILLLVGLFTRLGGLAVFGVMAAAMWLTEIGPALQSGDTWLGFLPLYDPWSLSTYSTFMWQLALGVTGLALLFSGPGMLSLDRFIFGKSVVDDED